MRSVRSPHGSSPSVRPTQTAARRRPRGVRSSVYSSRSAGAIAGMPSVNAEKLACAAVPAARIAHR
jgi:hypothetical protein